MTDLSESLALCHDAVTDAITEADKSRATFDLKHVLSNAKYEIEKAQRMLKMQQMRRQLQ